MPILFSSSSPEFAPGESVKRFGKVLLLALMATVMKASAQDAECASYHHGLPLYLVAVFDGPPEKLASLEADHSHRYEVWDVGYVYDASRKVYLVCHYGKEEDEQVITVKVEKRVEHCELRSSKGKPGELKCK
jgi:hypothetical protein